MLLRFWRLVTILLVALSMATAFCHLLEMPAKLKVDGALWLKLLQTLYPPAFGTVGGAAEVGALIMVVSLVFLVRNRRSRAFGWTLLAAICMVATHAAFWVWVSPVNAIMLPLTPDTLPSDWIRLRNQWEYTHAARAILQIVSLGAVVFSTLIEIPTDASRSNAA
jgi:hypothetical protein